MSVKLIYHTPESASGGISPFDEAITEIVSSKDTCIACPYLSLSYVQRIISLSKSWRLLTDIEEWLASCDKPTREMIRTFIRQYSGKIRHCKDLHAKVIIAEDNALVGSANFTEKGIKERTEVSVLFEHEPQVAELYSLFNTLWSQAVPEIGDELETYIDSLSSESIINVVDRQQTSLPSNALPIRSKLRPIAQYSNTRIIEFASDDNAYLEWLRLNPNGFIINTTKGKSPNIMVLHKATCHTICDYTDMAKPGGFTTRDYIKICSLEISELSEWVRCNGRNDGSFSKSCGKCNPM